MPVETDAALREILGHKRVGVVGCSTTPGKAAHDVPAYLQRHGYEIVPINPTAQEVLGRDAADSLTAVDTELPLVCIFRPSDEVAGIVDEAIDRGDVRVVWTQLGIRDPEAAKRAEDAGLSVVQDRCMKVEHGRLCG
ncbi:putative CoA-binding protein [Halovivax ruber XH-70]|uniref:Putative CoA-binding protein n=1 Tax=Halovivax ruber (strain DSM 18193 / JCM 13892 / XH-70) TaxID=797302 RepID=L0IBD0_HALRX|nr:CoA-binding protein [Halovivax ruber]AGB15551.1 putative CoA-binding protein [Halovivax ruber XH-70]